MIQDASLRSRIRLKLERLAQSAISDIDFCLNVPRIQQSAPVFVTGCKHSGTSIVHRLIGYHSAVFQIPQETYWFSSNCLSSLSKSEILSCMRLQSLFHSECFLEKTPKHIENLDLMWKIFPKARIVLMIRDPRDVIASLKARGIPLDRSIEIWKTAANIILSIQDTSHAMTVRLEDFLEDPASSLESLQQFLGLAPEDLLASHGKLAKRFYSSQLSKPSDVKHGQNHNQYRNWQINQPLMRSTRRWESELSSSDIAEIKSALGKSAKRFRYEV